MADVNAAWIMTSSAARLCQSLGWHRLTPERCGGDEKYHRKAVLFWSVYFIDKSLSLRLGRASAMQDYDISTSLKDLCGVWDRQEGGHHKMIVGWVELSIEMASLQVSIQPVYPIHADTHRSRASFMTDCTHRGARRVSQSDRRLDKISSSRSTRYWY